MATKVLWIVWAAIGVAAGAPAQGVVPALLDGVEGGGWSTIPFGFDRAIRYQCLYDYQELPWSGPIVMNGIAIRPDNRNPGTTTHAQKQFLQVFLTVSSTERDASQASRTLDDNLGTDATEVITDARIALPAVGPEPGTMPFAIDLPFDRPWFFDATPVTTGKPRNFMFDLRVDIQPAGAYEVDGPTSCTFTPTFFGNTGCLTSRLDPTSGARLPLGFQASETVLAGGPVTYTVDNLPPNGLFSVLMSFNRPTAQNPLPIPGLNLSAPVELTQANMAASSLGIQFGAPGCWIEIPNEATLGGIADSSGRGIASIGIPPGRAFVGVPFYGQALAFDPGANPLFVVTSQGIETQACGPIGVARVFALEPAGGGGIPTVGSRNIGNSVIIDVR